MADVQIHFIINEDICICRYLKSTCRYNIVYLFLQWVYLILIKKNNYDFVKKYLKLTNKMHGESDKELCRRFAEDYLRYIIQTIPFLILLLYMKQDTISIIISHSL